MSKKLMLLVAGALTALAFAALPAVASAGEFEAHCTNGLATCNGVITSTEEATLTTDGGSITEKVKCPGVTGTATQTSTTSTGTVQLEFTGCEEEFLHTQCRNTATNGKIVTNVLISHLIYIDPNKSTPGVLLTGVNTTFECPSVGVVKTVTGNIIGHWTNPQCGVAAASHTVDFTVEGNIQKYKTVTTAGSEFNLTSGTHPNNDTTESAQKGSGIVDIPSTFTC